MVRHGIPGTWQGITGKIGSSVARRITGGGDKRGRIGRLKTAVIVVAAGRGSRARTDATEIPKQYRMLGGKPVLQWTLEAIGANAAIDTILPVIHADDGKRYAALNGSGAARLREPAIGGETRQASVFAGLKALEEVAPDTVLIHDAARPFPSSDLIGRVIDGLRGSAAVIPALPVTETLKRADGNKIIETVDRSTLRLAQTPQGFDFASILDAHRAASQSAETGFTDDASVAEWHGLDMLLVAGEQGNVKLTTPEDFAIAEKQIGTGVGEIRIGQGYDVHGFTTGSFVKLCGVKIDFGKTLQGHSDADVGLHALTDALLGAIGDGDIGTHFPPSDPKWRGANSEVFLKDAARRVGECGGVVVNVDVTLICEEPKIGPHRELMREAIASILDIPVARVSVKATTTEGLGFTGRREGIAAMASASVQMA